MFRLFFIPLFFSFLVLLSCKKENTNSIAIQEDNFYALSVGNTWEYEVERYDEQIKEYELLDLSLKVLISETQEINGETYYRFQTTSTGSYFCDVCEEYLGQNELRRDSLGYLINDSGKYFFSSKNLNQYLINFFDWGSVFGVLKEGTEVINTSAGNFETIKNERYAEYPDGEPTPSLDYIHYSKEIGLIYTTISPATGSIARYKIYLKSIEINN